MGRSLWSMLLAFGLIASLLVAGPPAARADTHGVTVPVASESVARVDQALGLAPDSAPRNLTPLGDHLYFTAVDETGRQIWRTDGTAAGTEKLTDIEVDVALLDGWEARRPFFEPRGLRAVDGAIVFRANHDLWVLDPRTDPIRVERLTDLNTVGGFDALSDPAVVGSDVYIFNANTVASGVTELWRAGDGLTSPAVQVGTYSRGTTSSSHRLPRVTGSLGGEVLLYDARDIITSSDWLACASDGTVVTTACSGTQRLSKGSTPYMNRFYPSTFLEFGDEAYFTAWGRDGTSSMFYVELWATGGTQATTRQVQRLGQRVGTNARDAIPPVRFDADRMVFATASDVDASTQVLWVSNGEVDAATPFAGAAGALEPRTLTTVEDGVLFSAEDDTNGRELWFADAAANTATLVADMTDGVDGTSIASIVPVGGAGFVLVDDFLTKAELWVTDRTTDGTRLLGSFAQRSFTTNGSWTAADQTPVVFDGALWFGAADDEGDGLWRTVDAPPTWPAEAQVTLASAGPQFLDIAWDVADGTVAGYEVSVDGVVAVADTLDTSALLTGLSPDTAYDIEVRARGTSGALSDPLSATFRTTIDGGPVDLLPLQASNTPGAVELSWPQVDGASSLQVYRAAGDGDLVALSDELAAGTTSYLDTAVASETVYRYEVRSTDTSSAVTEVATVTTPPIELDTPTATPSQLVRGGATMAALGADLRITVDGDPYRAATATVTTLDAGGAAQVSTAFALDDADTDGTYRGTFAIATGMTEIVSVSVELCDVADVCATATSTVTLPVGGELEVVVDDTTGAFDGGTVVVSDSSGAGQQAAIDEDGAGSLGAVLDLPPGDAYSLQVLDGDGVVQDRRGGISVAAGARSQLQVVPDLRQPLDLEILGPDGQPSVGAWVTVTDASGHQTAGVTRAGGLVGLRDVLVGDLDVDVRTADDAVLGVVPDGGIASTYPAPAQPLTIQLAAPATTTLSGQVVESDGTTGVAFAQVSASFPHPGGGGTTSRTVTADAAGSYALEVLVGDVAVVASKGSRAAAAEVVVPDVGLDLPLELGTSPLPGQVELRLFAEYAGEPRTEVPIDMVTASLLSLRLDGEPVYGSPVTAPDREDAIEFCADGQKVGLPADCAAVEFVAEAGTAELVLAQPQAINARFVDDAGAPVTGFVTTRLTRLVEDTRFDTVTSQQFGDSASVLVPEPGTYEVSFRSSSGTTPVRVVTVEAGEAVDLGELTFGTTGPLVRASTLATARNQALPGDVVSLRAAVVNDASAAVDDLRIGLPAPTAAEIVPGSILVDGVAPADGALTGNLTDGSAELAIGTLAPGAAVTLHLAMRLDSDAPVRTVIEPGLDLRYTTTAGASTEERLVGAPVTVAGVTIEAPQTTTSHTVTLRGLAPAGSTVEITDGNVVIGLATASAGGSWRMSATLVDRGPYIAHTLAARVPDSPQFGRDETRLRFDDSAAQPLAVTLAHAGKQVTMDPRLGTSTFPFTYVPGKPFAVTAAFDRPDEVVAASVQIGQARVPLTRDGDVFSAEFDVPDDQLGPVWLDYGTTGRSVDLEAAFDAIQTPGMWQKRLPDPLQGLSMPSWEAVTPTSSAEVDEPPTLVVSDGSSGTTALSPAVDEIDEGDADATIVVTSSDPSGTQMTTTIRIRELDFEPSADELAEAERLGLPVYRLASRIDVLDDERFESTVSAVVAGEAVEEALAALEGATGVAAGGEEALLLQTLAETPELRTAALRKGIEVSAKLVLTFGDGKSLLDSLDAGSRYRELEDLLDQAGENCGGDAQEGYRNELDNLALATLASQYVAATTTAAAAATAAGGAVPASILIGLVGMGVGLAADYAIDDEIEDVRRRLQVDPDCPEPDPEFDLPRGSRRPADPLGDPRWIYDPAGFVFEAVASNVLEGATATAHEGLPADAANGDVVDTWQVWDATEYLQTNPLVTGADGTYAWDVPQGWWRVTASLDGYESTTSEPLEVLPIHLDVHLGLVSTRAPAVDDVVAYAGDGDGAGEVRVVFDHWMRADLTASRIEVRTTDDDVVAGTVTATDAEPHFLGRAQDAAAARVAPEDELLATDFVFTPDAPLTEGDALVVFVDGLAQGYHLRIVGDDVLEPVTVEQRPVDPDDGSGGSGSGGGGTTPPPSVPDEPDPTETPRFSDVGPDAVHGEAIEALAERGIVRGFPDGSFRPYVDLTRGQFATMLHEALGLPDGPTDAFPDAGTTHAAAIGALADAGIVGGYTNGTFRPWEPVTRGQMASMLARAADLPMGDGDRVPFDDAVGTTHATAIDAVARVGWVSGFPDGTFRPSEATARGQAATVVWRFVGHLEAIGASAMAT